MKTRTLISAVLGAAIAGGVASAIFDGRPAAGNEAPIAAVAEKPSEPSRADLIAAGAAREVANGTRYVETYETLAYPGGDVPVDVGVCTDLVVRAFRNAGIDLQEELHEDRVAHPEAYPTHIWENRKPDRNIDHRRCQNLQVFFSRFADRIPVDNPAAWRAGDVVFFVRSGAAHPWHVGVLDGASTGRPTMSHLYPPASARDFVDRYGPVQSLWRWPM